MRALCLLLLVSGVARADVFDRVGGPRVTLQAVDMPLAEAFVAVGRQINRAFSGQVLEQERIAQQPVSFALENATVTDALSTLEQVSELRLARQSRTRYAVAKQTGRLGLIGQPLGDWRVWLRAVTYSLTSSLDPADPERRYTRALLYTHFIIEAPDDLDSVRLRRISAAGVDGQARPNQADAEVTAPDSTDPRLWITRLTLDPPPMAAQTVDEVSLDLEVADVLETCELTFPDLASRTDETQTEGELDVQLQVPATRGTPLYRVSVFGPLPEDAEERRRVQRWSGMWVEPLLRDADGKQIFVECSAEGVTEIDGRLVHRYRVQPLEEDREPAALTVQVARPSTETSTRRVTFEGIPVPDRVQPEIR